MAVINIDLGSSDQTIDASTPGYEEGGNNLISLTSIGAHTLTADGVDVTVNQFAGISAISAPTFSAVNGANLTVDYGTVNVGLLNSTTYAVGNDSSISVEPSTLNLSVSPPTTVQFDSNGTGAFNYSANALTSTSLTVEGLKAGDSLSVDGKAINGFSYDAGTGTGNLTFGTTLNGQVTYQIQDMNPDLAAEIAADPSAYFQDGSFVMPVCFLRGTMIRTPDGEVAVQDLKAGDKVIGASGVREVKWIGYRKILIHSILEAERAKHLPIRIQRDAIADGVPARDILVSPGHHILVDGKLARAMDLLNGKTIRQEAHLVRFEYFHVELDRFDVVSAHGLMSESWADGGNRDYFANVDVTTLRPADRQRRRAERPGFEVLRKSPELTGIRARLAERAQAVIRVDALAKAA